MCFQPAAARRSSDIFRYNPFYSSPDNALSSLRSFPAPAPRRDNSVATKRNLVEILRFRHFSRHVVFDAEGDKFRNKRIEDYITVSVVIDMECGNTKN